MADSWIVWNTKTTVTLSPDAIPITKFAFPGKLFRFRFRSRAAFSYDLLLYISLLQQLLQYVT